MSCLDSNDDKSTVISTNAMHGAGEESDEATTILDGIETMLREEGISQPTTSNLSDDELPECEGMDEDEFEEPNESEERDDDSGLISDEYDGDDEPGDDNFDDEVPFHLPATPTSQQVYAGA